MAPGATDFEMFSMSSQEVSRRAICFVTLALLKAGARKNPISRELRKAACSAFRS